MTCAEKIKGRPAEAKRQVRREEALEVASSGELFSFLWII